MNKTLVWVVGLVVTALLIAFMTWTAYQGTLGWQDAYQTCLEVGNTPLECKVKVGA